MNNIFLKSGDKDVTELYGRLRMGVIKLVDTKRMTVMVEWLDKKGGRIEVPLIMPFCEQGWGIFAVPRKYSMVICDVRPFEFPIILSYIPPNFMTPNSNWSQYKQISNLVNMDSGEIILRNMIEKAKCNVCKKIYTLNEWAETVRYDDFGNKVSVEHCPNPSCNGGNPVPAIEFQGDKILSINKIQMGILAYFQKNGKLRIRLNDGLSAADGDTFASGSLIDIQFDENSNLVIDGIQNLNISSDSTQLSSTKNTNINGENVVLNNGDKGIARKEDKCGYLYFTPGAGGASLSYSKVKIIPPPGTEVGPIEIVDSSNSVKAGD